MNSLKNKILYGIASIGIYVIETFLALYLTLYVTDVLYLDPLLFASLLIAPRIIDVLIDIFIMYFVGRINTKFGKYKPWLLNMIPMTISFVIMFSTSYMSLSNNWILLILVITYFFSNSLCSSFYAIPYYALPGVISEKKEDILKLNSVKGVFANAGLCLVAISSMPLLLAFGGHKNPKGWLVLSLIFGSISLIASLLCFFFLKTNKELEKSNAKSYSIKDTVQDYKYILKNRNFLFNSFILFSLDFTYYTFSATCNYFFIYNMHAEDMIMTISLLACICSILTSIVTPSLVKKVGDKIALIIYMGISIVSALFTMFASNITSLAIGISLRAIGASGIEIIIFYFWPIIANQLDETKIKSRLNNTIALGNMIGNLSLLTGTFVGSLIISLSRYDATLETQSSFTLDTFRYATPIIIIVLMAISIFLTMIQNKKIRINQSNKEG